MLIPAVVFVPVIEIALAQAAETKIPSPDAVPANEIPVTPVNPLVTDMPVVPSPEILIPVVNAPAIEIGVVAAPKVIALNVVGSSSFKNFANKDLIERLARGSAI